MPAAISLARVTKTFGSKVAVRDLDLTIPEGSMYGFIGPNGAGKTTTIRMIMSILFPDSGELSVLGHGSALEAKDRIGYLPEERGVYKKMKVGSFLRYMARLKGYKGLGLHAKVREWLTRLELADVESKRCDELSKGMQQKLQFITAVLHEPDLLIFDEPFSGLDPVNMRLLRKLIREQHQRGATIIFSTHVMTQAEQLCDHVVMIDNGLKVLDESLSDIRTKFSPHAVLFEPLVRGADLWPIRSLSLVQEVRDADGCFEVSLRDGTDIGEAVRAIAGAVPAARVEVHRPTLEDVFVEIVNEARGVTFTGEQARRLRESLKAGYKPPTEEAHG